LGFCRITKSSDGKLVLQPEALALFATHYKTGEMIPMEYVQKIKES
jgi:Zn-dependent oligopeptidase